jgi:transposase InsO family protein
MPWEPVTVEQQRREFVMLAQQETVSFRELCRRFGISRRIGYKWCHRFAEAGAAGLQDRSRRPHQTRPQVAVPTQQAIVALRQAHPCWGARKLRRLLQNRGLHPLPATSSITATLHRHALIGPDSPAGQQPWVRFEHPAPNSLWQMDFKAPVATHAGTQHVLSVLDDHSRFALCLQALSDQQGCSVQAVLVGVFRRYGVPEAMLSDNGPPWGNLAADAYGALAVWLMRLGVYVTHSRPSHPQTVGKDERFHGTLERELLARHQWRDGEHLQAHLDPWRQQYNCLRPHEALELEVPASRYQPSLHPYPEQMEPIHYPPGMPVRKVQDKGRVHYKGRLLPVSQALRGQPVGVRATATDGLVEVLFCHQVVKRLNLAECRKAE